MFWFMLLFAWIWLLITILSDIFRDRTLGGWSKALWVLFIIILAVTLIQFAYNKRFVHY